MSGNYFRRDSTGIRRSSVAVEVPNNPKSNLMYYVACICSVLDLESEKNIERLRDFKKHYLLTEKEVNQLLLLCYVLNPDYFIKKCIFQDDIMCGENQNEFYELRAFQRRFPVAPVVVDGVPRQVLKIMCFKIEFLIDNYYEPMLFYKPKLKHLLSLQDDEFDIPKPEAKKFSKSISDHPKPGFQTAYFKNKIHDIKGFGIIEETYPSPCCDCWSCTIL